MESIAQKSKKFIVVNSKGGVAKSTNSSNLLASFLYRKTKEPVKLIEVDEINRDVEKLSNSSIIQGKVLSLEKFKSDVIDIMFDDKDIIIDVAGGKTTLDVIDIITEFEVDSELIWIIPLTAGESESDGARRVLKKIQKLNRDPKVIFILANSPYTDEDMIMDYYFEFFGSDVIEIDEPIIELVKDVRYVVMPSDSSILYAKKVGLTVFEMANLKVDYSKQMLEAKDIQEKKEVARRSRLFKKCHRFTIEHLNSIFRKLDEIL